MTASSIEGLIYLTLYRLHRHYFLGWTLVRWLVILSFALPILLFTGIIPGGIPMRVIGGSFSLSVLFLIWRTRRFGFHRFIAAENHPFDKITADALPFSKKIPIRVSGVFAVGKNRQNFVDEPAFYQTFETRERVLMLKISQSPNKNVGWWYNFFTPAQVQAINYGILKFGLQPRPALQLIVKPDGSEKVISFIIATDSPDNMTQILADLKADGLN